MTNLSNLPFLFSEENVEGKKGPSQQQERFRKDNIWVADIIWTFIPRLIEVVMLLSESSVPVLNTCISALYKRLQENPVLLKMFILGRLKTDR